MLRRTRHAARTGSGKQETVSKDDLFYWPPGHRSKVEQDAEIEMLSPQREHAQVIGHMCAKASAESRSGRRHGDRMHPTKQLLLDAGLPMLQQHGYNDRW